MQSTETGSASRGRAVALPVIACALAVAAAACGSSPTAAPAASSSSSSRAAASPSASMTEPAATIGTDCGMIPAAGMGSIHALAMDPVVTAASHNPLITTLAAEIRKAGLAATLNAAKSITVFAPDNAAFRKLTEHDMTMMSGTAELARTLKYHIARGRITPAELASGMTVTTLEGGQLKTSKMGSTYEVNSAAITCGNLHTANATIYIIDTVLMPAR